MSQSITSSTDSSLSTPSSSASASSITAVPASTTAVTATIFASASSSLQFDPPQQTMAPFNTESHLYDYDSDSEEKNSGVKRPYTAEEINLEWQAQILAPLPLKVVSLKTILEGLNIPKADWDNYVFGARQFYAIEPMGEMEPRVFIAQGKCFEAGREIPLSLYSFIVQLHQLLSESDRNRLLENFSMENASSLSTPSSASSSSLSTPSSASASSTTAAASASSMQSGSSQAHMQTSLSSHASSSMGSASIEDPFEKLSIKERHAYIKKIRRRQEKRFAPLRSIDSMESILKGLKIPQADWDNHVYGARQFYVIEEGEVQYRLFKAQAECYVKNGKSPESLAELIGQLEHLQKSDRERFLEGYSFEEGKGSDK